MNQELLRAHGCQSIEVSKLSFGSDPLPDGDIDLVIGSDVTCVAYTFPSSPTIYISTLSLCTSPFAWSHLPSACCGTYR